MGVVLARVTQPCQPSPVPRPDRPAHRPFRGLLSVHSRCGLHTRTVTVCRNRYPKASDTSSPPCLLRSLPAGAVAGWGLHPLEKRRLVTAHVESCHSFRCCEWPRRALPRALGVGKPRRAVWLRDAHVSCRTGVITAAASARRPWRSTRPSRILNLPEAAALVRTLVLSWRDDP